MKQKKYNLMIMAGVVISLVEGVLYRSGTDFQFPLLEIGAVIVIAGVIGKFLAREKQS